MRDCKWMSQTSICHVSSVSFSFPVVVTQMDFPLDSLFPPHMDSAMRPLNISMFAKKRNYLLVGLTRPEWHFQRLNSNGVNVLKSNHGESNYTHAKAEPNTSSNKTRSHIIILLSAVQRLFQILSINPHWRTIRTA